MEVSSLMKTADNMADSKAFLDWLLTPEAAALYGERSEMSVVPGAKPTEAVLKAGLPADATTILYPMDFGWSAQNKDRILGEWTQKLDR
jgi:iron(III) transport system substrate-binding protein